MRFDTAHGLGLYRSVPMRAEEEEKRQTSGKRRGMSVNYAIIEQIAVNSQFRFIALPFPSSATVHCPTF